MGFAKRLFNYLAGTTSYRVDRLIAEKKLRIRHLRKKVKTRKKENFMKRMESLPAQVKLVQIDGLAKTSEE